MFNRFCFGVLLLAGLALPFTGCDTSTGLDSITVSPTTNTMVVGGATLQLTAEGTYGNAAHTTTSPVSNATWSSSPTTVATVDASTGVVTAVGVGTAVITATASGYNGPVSATVNVTVTAGAGTGTGSRTLLSISIVPGGITVSNKGMNGQFLAFGNYSTAPTVVDLTNQVTWLTTSPEVATIDSTGTTGETGGLATAMGYTGGSVIYAEGVNPDGTVVLSNPETFTCADSSFTPPVCNQNVATPLLATLTFYNAGENTTTWLVTDNHNPNVIHCGGSVEQASPGGSVCTGTYAVGTVVTLTASPTGGNFGGWTSNCETALNTPNLTPTCTFQLNGNMSAGAIFY